MLLLVLTLGCQFTSWKQEKRDEPVLAGHLDHATDAEAARDAVIRGDVAAAAARAGALRAVLPVEGLDAASSGFHEAYVDALDGLEGARTVADAGAAVGRLAASCGACHAGIGRPVPMPALEPPATGGDAAAEMARHQLAARALWQGLVGPSEPRVAEAVALLGAAPMLAASDEVPPLAAALERRVHTLAAAPGDAAARAEAYGEMLATCAECHTLLRAD